MSTGSTSRVEIEKFNGKSFELWKLKMEDLLVDRDLWTVIEDPKPVIATDKESTSTDSAAEKVTKEEVAVWEKLDRKARGLIRLCLSDSVLVNVATEKTAKELWNKLESLYQSKSLVNKLFLRKKLYKLQMVDGGSFSAHLQEFNTLVSQLASISYDIGDADKAITLLCSLPDSWDNLIVAIGSGTTDLSFESVVSALLSEEMRRQGMESSSKEALFVRGRTQNRNTKRSGNRSKSRGKSKGVDYSKMRCWNCNEVGHGKRDCPNKATKKDKGDLKK
ncbi:hypothetical protein HGI15_22025, partial [Modestobacter lapidis]|nr:hypothetical protein [Modestobacter lapidis]